MILKGPGPTAGEALRVCHKDPRVDPRWRDFVLAHPKASIYHHPAWIRALEAEYGQPVEHLACEREDGQLLAVIPLLRTRGVPLRFGGSLARRRLASLPRTPLAGPLSYDSRATAMLLREAIRLAVRIGAVLEIKSGDRELDTLAEGLVAVPWRRTYVLQLAKKHDGPFCIQDLKERGKIKWAIAKAARMGLTVRPADTEQDIREWYRVYLATMRRSIIPPRPLRLFTTIWQSPKPAGMMDLLLASFRKDGADHASDAILWHAINNACARGFRKFDFGEVPEGNSALARFKIKWGAEPERLYRYYSPATSGIGGGAHQGSGAFPSAVWRRLPLKLTEWIGDRVYSYL